MAVRTGKLIGTTPEQGTSSVKTPRSFPLAVCKLREHQPNFGMLGIRSRLQICVYLSPPGGKVEYYSHLQWYCLTVVFSCDASDPFFR